MRLNIWNPCSASTIQHPGRSADNAGSRKVRIEVVRFRAGNYRTRLRGSLLLILASADDAEAVDGVRNSSRGWGIRSCAERTRCISETLPATRSKSRG